MLLPDGSSERPIVLDPTSTDEKPSEDESSSEEQSSSEDGESTQSQRDSGEEADVGGDDYTDGGKGERAAEESEDGYSDDSK